MLDLAGWVRGRHSRAERIRIVSAREHGQNVVAVLSARGKTTDELIAQARELVVVLLRHAPEAEVARV